MDPWVLYAALAVATVLQVAAVFWFIRRHVAAAGTRPAGTGSGGHDAVGCPHCGTPNAPEYRFCRSCAGELAATSRSAGGRELEPSREV